MNKIIRNSLLFFSSILVVLGFGCSNKQTIDSKKNQTNNTVIDGAGRTVLIPSLLDQGIVTIGSSGPLRFLSIFDVFDYVVEVDKGDVTDNKNGRAYSYAFPFDTFTADQWHPDSALESETAEKIATRKPALIIVQKSVYTNYQENCELLASQFPLAVLPEQSMVEFMEKDYTLSPWYEQTVSLLGRLLKMESRAEEHIQDVHNLFTELRDLRGESNSKVYVAGLTWQGSNELTTTFPTYLPLLLSGGVNAHGGSQTSRVVMDPEVVTTIPMDYFVIDPSSSDKLSTPNSQFILSWLYMRNIDTDYSKHVKIYSTLPMIWDSANYDCVLSGAYFLTHLLYNSLTLEEVEQKVNTIFELYYGKNGTQVFPKMKEFFNEKSNMYKQDIPLLRELTIIQQDGVYSLKEISKNLLDFGED